MRFFKKQSQNALPLIIFLERNVGNLGYKLFVNLGD